MTRRVKTHIRLRIRSVFPSDQSPRCTHEKTLGPYLPIAKFRGISPRSLAECLREMSRSFSTNFRGVSSAKFHGENPRRNKWLLFFSAKKKLFRARSVPRRNAKKELFSWADMCVMTAIHRQKAKLSTRSG